ncbi:MAG: DNA topoisomerase 1 [Firmicutes bacterium]|nr:DNA topoisomerase 1 [Bacillota bacterium]
MVLLLLGAGVILSHPWIAGGLFVLAAVVFVYLPWRKKRAAETALRKSGIDEIDFLSGEDFESFLSLCFREHGYKVQLTPKSHDFGADLILSKDGIDTVVQAKRWRQTVGIEAVQQVVAAKQYYGASRAMVITNSRFTAAAFRLGRANHVTLWSREELVRQFAAVNGAALIHTPPVVISAPDTQNPTTECPRCGKNILARSGRLGKFYGCSGYPACRYTRDATQ